jgi:hypothetical protein
MVKKFCNIIWNNGLDTPKLLDNTLCQKIATEAISDSRIRQCAAKQASSIMRGVTDKRRKQLYKLKELQQEGKSVKYLQRKIEKTPVIKPEIKQLNVELDSRFVDFQEGDKEFDVCTHQANWQQGRNYHSCKVQ